MFGFFRRDLLVELSFGFRMYDSVWLVFFDWECRFLKTTAQSDAYSCVAVSSTFWTTNTIHLDDLVPHSWTAMNIDSRYLLVRNKFGRNTKEFWKNSCISEVVSASRQTQAGPGRLGSVLVGRGELQKRNITIPWQHAVFWMVRLSKIHMSTMVYDRASFHITWHNFLESFWYTYRLYHKSYPNHLFQLS